MINMVMSAGHYEVDGVSYEVEFYRGSLKITKANHMALYIPLKDVIKQYLELFE